MNRLSAVRPAIEGKSEHWVYRCSCGNERVLARRSVLSGNTKSCGCLNTELRLQRNTKHGLSKRGDPVPDCYWVWVIMKQRCSNPKNISYKYYGAKGVSVCQSWVNSFEAFIKDMGPRPTKQHSIDRINPFGNYEPENCRWATKKEQAINQRRNYGG